MILKTHCLNSETKRDIKSNNYTTIALRILNFPVPPSIYYYTKTVLQIFDR